MAFIHQDLWYGKVVPSSHLTKKVNLVAPYSALSAEEIIDSGRVFQYSLREEWALLNISGFLKSQWVTISTAPNLSQKKKKK